MFCKAIQAQRQIKKYLKSETKSAFQESITVREWAGSLYQVLMGSPFFIAPSEIDTMSIEDGFLYTKLAYERVQSESSQYKQSIRKTK